MDDNGVRIGPRLRRHDMRDPHLEPGERLLLDFTTSPEPGDVVLIRIDGRFKLAIVPADGVVVGIVRLVPD